ncbi:MAG: dihydroorotate dehydrogenase electron transfer subunit [Oscillospiraceae bacterium]|nr:dihydroorotate dehydrogenase electron transfer subunit [Oscillospiraceae bacterium]
MARQEMARILQNECIALDTYSLWLDCPALAREAQPGQFVHVLCGEKTLRRPISICHADALLGRITLVYAVHGEGTAWLSRCLRGQQLDVLGPLGNGFPVLEKPARLLVVGGGIGVPPLLDCSLRCGAKSVDAVLGFRTQAQCILEAEFERKCASVTICTEDGSYGVPGRVTAPMEALLQQGGYSAVYACGPVPMLNAVVQTVAKYGVPCQISLEERMGCGVGACLVCAAKIRRTGTEDYLRVCKEGPVFNAEEVVFE